MKIGKTIVVVVDGKEVLLPVLNITDDGKIIVRINHVDVALPKGSYACI